MIDVIYVAGEGRSGSTVLDRILGSLPGVTSQNELYRVWRHGVVEQAVCSCGERFDACPFWRAVVQRLGGVPDLETDFAMQRHVEQSRAFIPLYFGAMGSARKQELAVYRERLRLLYEAIAEVSGTTIIVDSSKTPGRALVLAGIPGIRVHVVHLVRDARAVLYAWTKRPKLDPAKGRKMRAKHPLVVLTYWVGRNIFAAALARRVPYTRVYYEDLVAAPKAVLTNLVASIAALRGKTLTFVDDRTIALGPLHTMSGNPGRFKTGPETLVADERWRGSIGRGAAALATILAGPLLLQYGYLTGAHRPGAAASQTRSRAAVAP